LTGDKAVYTITLEEAFPTVVSQTALNNSANDAISELTVNFAYTRFTTVNRKATPGADFVQSQVGTLIGNLANKLF
jgi:hypothetical protein